MRASRAENTASAASIAEVSRSYRIAKARISIEFSAMAQRLLMAKRSDAWTKQRPGREVRRTLAATGRSLCHAACPRRRFVRTGCVAIADFVQRVVRAWYGFSAELS